MQILKLLLAVLLTMILFGCSTNAVLPGAGAQNTLTGTALSGVQAYVLTGESLKSTANTINGLAMDTSSVTAIESSVAAIFASNYRDGTLITESTATTSDLAIDFTADGKAVSDIYYGANIQIASKKYLSDPVYQALIGNMKMDIIRFPGGQERVRYERTAPADSVSSLGSGNEYQFLLTGADVANYIGLCKKFNIKADPEVNVFTKDTTMWTNLVDQIVNELGYPLEYISVGNEPDINTNKNWDYFQATTMSGAVDSYMSRYNAYAIEIRKQLPSVTFILGELSSSSEPGLSTVVDQMLPLARANVPGAFSCHWYMLGSWGQPSNDPGFPSIEHMVVSGNSGKNIRDLSRINSTIRTKLDATFPQLRTKIVIGEWAVSWDARAEGADARGGLAAAIYHAEVMEYGKVLGIDSMQYFGMSDPADWYPWNTSLITETNGNFGVRPAYVMRMMYRHAWGNTMIPVPSGQSDAYSVYASKEAGNNYVMLINRTANQSIVKTINLKTSARPDGYNVDVLILPKSVTILKM